MLSINRTSAIRVIRVTRERFQIPAFRYFHPASIASSRDPRALKRLRSRESRNALLLRSKNFRQQLTYEIYSDLRKGIISRLHESRSLDIEIEHDEF